MKFLVIVNDSENGGEEVRFEKFVEFDFVPKSFIIISRGQADSPTLFFEFFIDRCIAFENRSPCDGIFIVNGCPLDASPVLLRTGWEKFPDHVHDVSTFGCSRCRVEG